MKKKTKLYLVLATTALVFVGCSTGNDKESVSTSEVANETKQTKKDDSKYRVSREETDGPAKHMDSSVKASTRETPENKAPDPNAADLSIVSVYMPVSDSEVGLTMSMDGIASLEPQNIIDKLIEYKVLPEGTKVNAFDLGNGKATLDISEIDTSDKRVVTSVANTFIENMELDSITILINGAENADTKDLTFNSDYTNLAK